MRKRKRDLAAIADLYDLLPPRQPAVLLVEDEERVAQDLRELISIHAATLPAPGAVSAWHIDWARTLAEAGERLHARTYDLLLIDRGMPDGDGLDFVARQRGMGLHTPMLMLTQFGERDAELAGLLGGADDYVRKPPDPELLLARIARLTQALHRDQRRFMGELEIDFAGHGAARYAGREMDLPRAELRLLAYLMLKAPTMASREELAEQVWGTPDSLDSGSTFMDVRIKALRESLEKYQVRFSIEAQRGYRMLKRQSGWKLVGADVPPEPGEGA